MEVKPGTIPDGWRAAPLGQLCGRITTGRIDANAIVADGDYPFFTCARESYRIDKYAFDCEALLVSGNGANVGYVHYYNGRFNAYQRTYVISDFSADVHFLRLFLDRNLQDRIRVEVNAGNTPYITMGTLTEMEVVLPSSSEEQRAIAMALSDVDALLGALDRLIAKKRDLKQAAMQQLLTGQTRLPGFHGEWVVKRLGDVVDTDPENLGSDTKPDFTFNYIALEDVDRGFLRSHSEQLFANAPSRARRKLRDDDVLVSTVRPNLQSHLLFRAEAGSWVCSTGFCVVRCREGVTHPGYVFCHLFAICVNRQIEALLTGSNYPAINSGDVPALEIPFPSLPEQTAIAAVLTEMDAELALLEQRQAKTRALKQGMMQELLTGRTRLLGNSGGARFGPESFAMSDEDIQELENEFPALSGQAFAAARRETLDAGLSVLESRDGVIYEVFPDGHRKVVKEIEPPTYVERGEKIRIR